MEEPSLEDNPFELSESDEEDDLKIDSSILKSEDLSLETSRISTSGM